MFAASIQSEGVLAKSKSQSGLDTMQARFPTGEPIRGRAWVLCARPHFPLASLSGSWVHTTQNSLL